MNDKGGSESERNAVAFVIVKQAAGHYLRDIRSFVEYELSFGDKIEILDRDPQWLRIKFRDVEAWSLSWQFSYEIPDRPISPVDQPYHNARASIRDDELNQNLIEYGPRGGRFTRTRTGYRRYF